MLPASVLSCLLRGMNSSESFTFRLQCCQCRRLPRLQYCLFKKPGRGLHLFPSHVPHANFRPLLALHLQAEEFFQLQQKATQDQRKKSAHQRCRVGSSTRADLSCSRCVIKQISARACSPVLSSSPC